MSIAGLTQSSLDIMPPFEVNPLVFFRGEGGGEPRWRIEVEDNGYMVMLMSNEQQETTRDPPGLTLVRVKVHFE